MKTAEEFVLSELFNARAELEEAKRIIERLEADEPEEKDFKPAICGLISRETCILSVVPYYTLEQDKHFMSLTAEEVREIIDFKLEEYAKIEYERYSGKEKGVNVKHMVFPYTLRVCNKIILLDVYGIENQYVNASIMGDPDKLIEGTYYDYYVADKLYKYGLEQFKEELERVYERKLKKEKANE